MYRITISTITERGVLPQFFNVFAHKCLADDYVKMYRAWPHLANRPSCPAGSVVVSSRRVYHLDSSPYKASVVPRYCFESEEKAKEAGFKAPK